MSFRDMSGACYRTCPLRPCPLWPRETQKCLHIRHVWVSIRDTSGTCYRTCPGGPSREDAPADGLGSRREGRRLVVEHDAPPARRPLEPDEAVPAADIPLP